MAPDQGKTCNVNALAILGEITHRTVSQVGTTTFRPPYHPVTIGALAGTRVGAMAQRYRRLPVSWHERNGGVMEDHSGWLRAAYYLRDGESEHDAITREVVAARTQAALFDSYSLGKIEVFGRDAAEFLNRLYVNNVKTLQPGRMRYGMMLSENGIIRDDGVFACLKPNHYLVCTSSAGAREIHFWMEEWLQCEWRDLDVRIVPQTAQWATLTVSGPRSRDVVARLDPGIDLSAQAFPHMHFREGRHDGAPMRVRRASFTGEMSFELDVPADRADALWSRLIDLGAADGITALGMEALDILRVEKGFLEVGVDTDGETTPLDVGWGAAIAKKPDDFVGRRSLQREAQVRADRLQLVGLLPEDPLVVVPVGAHAVDGDGHAIGHVTSSCRSPTLQRCVAMGRVRAGAQRMGEIIAIDVDGVRYRVRIVDRAFYDPKGARLDG
jgi:sarcosine oxidase subunit alpha